MIPSRDHTPEGFERVAEIRAKRRHDRWGRRSNGLRRALMRQLGYEDAPPAPVYRQLARKPWRVEA